MRIFINSNKINKNIKYITRFLKINNNNKHYIYDKNIN